VIIAASMFFSRSLAMSLSHLFFMMIFPFYKEYRSTLRKAYSNQADCIRAEPPW